MTQRSPLYVRLPTREWPRELLTWIDGGPQLGSQPTPAIQRQPEWPNPVIARANLELRTWSNALPPGVVGNPVPPILNRDWPNPTLRVQNHELRTWIHAQQLTPPTVLPFGQTDWPNPRAQARNQDLLSWVEGLPQTALALTLPLRQLDWPNPVLARPNLELRTWVEGIPQAALALTLPLRQTEWPNPVLAQPPNITLRSWSNGLPAGQIALTVPPVQLDWPNPAPSRPNLELRSWTLAPQQQPAVQSAFSQFDWPNPSPLRANLELRSWAYTDSTALLSVIFVTVPNVVGETDTQATIDIGAQGLITSITTAYSDTVAAGLVISQDPIGGASVGSGSIVTILVSLGAQPMTGASGASGGGGGSIDYQSHKRHKPGLRKQIDDILDSAEAAYRALLKGPEPEQAAKLVKPFAENKREAVPQPETIDWKAVERDVTRTRRLIALASKLAKQREIDEDDDEFMLLH